VNLVEGLANIKLGKDLGIQYSGKCLINQGEQVLVSLSKAIKLTVVNTEA